jgi:hypothetical protein
MRALPIVIATAIAVPALAACGNNAAKPDINAVHSSGLAAQPPPPATTAAATSARKESPRGAIMKKVGEVAALCADDSCTQFAVTFTLDRIEVNPKCTGKYARQSGSKPERGHFVALTFTVKTTEKFAADQALFTINPYDFSVVGPDGLTETMSPGSSTYECLPNSELLPTAEYAPASQYVGKVLLDTKHPKGILMFRPPATGAGGWEWEF